MIFSKKYSKQFQPAEPDETCILEGSERANRPKEQIFNFK